MSINIKPKQAFGFLSARNCVCGTPYCQPILTTDSFMLQGTLDEATDINLLSDGEFSASTNWTLGAGWSIAGGKLVATNISGTTAVSIAPIGLTVGKIYLIQMQLTVTSAGGAGVDEGWILKVNGDSLKLPNTTLGQGYNASLTGSWVYSPSAIASDVVEFSTDQTSIDFEVSYLRIYEVSQPAIALYRGATQVENITSFSGSNSLKYYFAGDLFMTNGALVGGNTNLLLESVTSVSVLWELFINTWDSITDETGCLTAWFYDTTFLSNRVRNGGFAGTLDYWTVGSHWALGVSDRACYTGDGMTAGALSQTVTLLGGSIYNFSFVLSGMTISSSMQVQFTTSLGSEIITYTGNSASPRTHEIDLTTLTGLQSVTISFQENGTELTFCVDDVSIISATPDDYNITNCINIQTQHPCTLLLYATNLDNAFGLDYTTGALRHYLRVYGKIKYSDYPEEAEVFKFSDNSYQLMQASSEKEFEVIIGDAPEQIHDCISILRLHDLFTIDGDSFVRSGNYDLNRRRTSDNSQAIFTVKEKTGVSSNYSCS